jgi:electron transport complex protein RnfD
MQDIYSISVSPHLQKRISTSRIMWLVLLSLIPAGVSCVLIFGMYALDLILVSVGTAIISEAVILSLRGKKLTILDGSAALTGLLLAYNLPDRLPLWMAALGSFFAVAVVKQAFGGLGRNIFNPALAARAFLLLSFPKSMSTFGRPFAGADAVSSATPLALLKEGKFLDISQIGLSYTDLFMGNRGGSIGEVCIFALLLGGLFLLLSGIISWHIPFSFISSVALLSWLFSPQGLLGGDWLFSVLSGGLILGAFFMATDYVTSPLTNKGKLIFGFGCGVLTFIIRRWGGYPEGVSFSILIMNATVPLIDRFVKPRIYGKK